MHVERKFERERQRALKRKARVIKRRQRHQFDPEAMAGADKRLLLLIIYLVAAAVAASVLLFVII